jgi:hypothetical protein
MSKSLINSLIQANAALAALVNALAAEFAGVAETATVAAPVVTAPVADEPFNPDPGPVEATEPKKRHRRTKAEMEADRLALERVERAEKAAAEPPVTEGEPVMEPVTLTEDEAYTEICEAVQSLVDAGRGAEVRKVIQRHSNGGNLRELARLFSTGKDSAPFYAEIKNLIL